LGRISCEAVLGPSSFGGKPGFPGSGKCKTAGGVSAIVAFVCVGAPVATAPAVSAMPRSTTSAAPANLIAFRSILTAHPRSNLIWNRRRRSPGVQ